tara:strand:+ start:1220 stop:1876 length:657 start_codon:yes stop_codon:yes gene_type:complete
MSNLIKQAFEDINLEYNELIKTKNYVGNQLMGGGWYVDNTIYLKWTARLDNLINLVCKPESNYCKNFDNAYKGTYSTNFNISIQLKAVLDALQADFEAGYLTSLKYLVQADVFESELEQAEELLRNDYKLAAAVVAGVVLETALRDLCQDNNIDIGSLNKMNQDLAKAEIYNKLQQKRITALADIRNNAAHGKPDEFSSDDVKNMIREIESFLTSYMK